MNPAIYSTIFLLLLVLIFQRMRRKKLILTKIITAKKKRGTHTMKELALRFIGKECLIYAFDSQITGIITEVTDNALLIDNKGTTEVVNLDFIVRIKEYPKNKNGKKKSVVLD